MYKTGDKKKCTKPKSCQALNCPAINKYAVCLMREAGPTCECMAGSAGLFPRNGGVPFT
jgi:hypothetical protein